MGDSSLDRERRRKDFIESNTLAMRVEEVSNPRVKLALDAEAREFVEPGRMPVLKLLLFCGRCDVFLPPLRLH